MKTAHVASFALLFCLTGCDRISALVGHGDAGATAATPSASASASATTAAATPPPPPPVDPNTSLAGFEGEIDLSARSKSNPPVSLALVTKDDQIRFALPADLLARKDVTKFTGGGNVYAVLKPHDKKLTVVLDQQKRALVIDLDQAGERLKGMKGHRPGASSTPGATPEPPKVIKTGKTETVAGLTCEDWDILNVDKTKASLCVATQAASFFGIPLTGLPIENAWALELIDGKHIPLRAVSFDRDGAETGRVEVTKFDKHPVDAAQFEIPAGYTQMTLDELLAALGGGGAPPGDMPHENPHGHGRHHGHH